MHLDKLVVQSRVRNRREMKNGIELFVGKLIPPIERFQILRDKVATVADEILEIAGAKVIDYREARVRKFFLQSEREIGADEAGPAGDEQIGRRSS